MEKIDYDNLTGQELKEQLTKNALTLESLSIPALEKLLAYETELLCHGAGDIEIITCCSKLLTAKENYETKNIKTKSDFAALVKKTINDNLTIVENSSSQTIKAENSPERRIPKTRNLLKRVAVIAAVILILSTATVGVASTLGVNILGEGYKIPHQGDSADELTFANGEETEYYSQGGNSALTDVNGLTSVNGGKTKYYSSVEEFTKENNWEILYPTKLPQNTVITKLKLTKSASLNDEISISTNKKQIMICIERNISEEDWNKDELREQESIYESNGIKYLIIPDNNIFYAICYYNGDHYSVQAENYDDLILIIDNLKLHKD